ncbi:MAG: hypothetical protein ACYS8W_11410 [Planctomycetota bacterium]|jgi:hypothetical protein
MLSRFFTVLLLIPALAILSCNIKGFEDRPYLTPMVITDTPAGMQAEDVTLTYRLIEFDGSFADISLEYSIDSGQTWNPGTAMGGDGTSGLEGGVFPGKVYTIIWDSFADGVSGSSSCRVRLTPVKMGGGAAGTAGETGDFQIQNPDFPVISWVSKPEGTVREVPLTFTWKLDTPAVPIASYYYGLDEDPPTSPTTSTLVTIPAPAFGPHTFRVYASSTAGLNSAVLTADLTCDNAAANVPPTVTIISGPSGTTFDDTPTFEYTGDDVDGSVAGYYVGIDENPPSTWTTNTTWTSPSLPPGGHNFYVMAQDNEGENSSVAVRAFGIAVISGPIDTLIANNVFIPTGYDVRQPRQYITRTSDGRIHCVFRSEDNDSELRYTVSSDGGLTFTDGQGGAHMTAEIVNTQGIGLRINPTICSDSADTLHVMFHDGYSIYHMTKTGAGWSSLDNATFGHGYEDMISECRMAFDSGGYLHIIFTARRAGDDDYYDHNRVVYAGFNGLSWTGCQDLTNGTYRNRCPLMAIDQNRNIHLSWSGLASYDQAIYMMGTYTGSGWAWPSDPTVIPYEAYGNSHPGLAVDRNGTVHIMYIGVSDDDIRWWRKPSGGSFYPVEVLEITSIFNIAVDIADNLFFSLSVDEGNDIHAFWNVAHWNGETGTYIKKGINGGTSWEPNGLMPGTPGPAHISPCAIYSLYPQKDGKSFCAPKSGYALGYWVFPDGYWFGIQLRYHASGDLLWP